MNPNRFYITDYAGAVISGPHDRRTAQALVGDSQKIRTEAQLAIVRSRGAPTGNSNAAKYDDVVREQFRGERAVRDEVRAIGDGQFNTGIVRLLEFWQQHH